MTIEYDGAGYGGWQKQKTVNSQQLTVNRKQKTENRKQKTEIKTIQGTIENALEKILQEKISLIGSGRTDAGVHALEQVANFKTKNSLDINSLQSGLNSLLPADIVIKKAREIDEKFHSRYSAKSKVYQYTILNNPFPSSFLRNLTYFYPYPLNLSLLKREVKCLLGRHDFKSFCASGSGAKDTIRTIKRISVEKFPAIRYPLSADLIFFTIEADGFLYKMARNIIGTLIDINREKIKNIKDVLTAKERTKAGATAPPQGLCLLKVKY